MAQVAHRVELKKDLLHAIDGEDRVCGKESVIDMTDMRRYKYLRDMGHVIDAPEKDLTIFPPPPKPARDKTADNIGEVIANAIKKGLVYAPEKEDAESK
jgi:hypothetical protein